MSHHFLSQTVSRRQFTRAGAAGLVALRLAPSSTGIARAAANASEFSALGYPVLNVTITDAAIEGVADTLPAGRYLIKATTKVTDASNGGGAVSFLSGSTIGMSGAELLQLIASTSGPPPDAAPSADATPDSGGDQNQMLPLVVYQLHFTGGVEAVFGDTAEAVIDLTPGEYVLWADDPEAPQKPTVVTVTGEYPQDVQDPEADITATLVDFAITFDGDLTAGRHVLKVQHMGAQPHFLFVAKGPDSMTQEQAVAAMSADPSASPTPGGLNEQDFRPVFYSPTQSIGTVTYHHLDLEAGSYLAACFFPTAGTGVPHAANGMVDVVKVGGSATPAATPTS